MAGLQIARDRSWLNNPIVNPFYRSQRDEEEDAAAREEHETTSRNASVVVPESATDEKQPVPTVEGTATPPSEGGYDADGQEGLKKSEAITQVWTKKSLIITYIAYVGFFIFPLPSTMNDQY